MTHPRHEFIPNRVEEFRGMNKEFEMDTIDSIIEDLTKAIRYLAQAMNYCAKELDNLKNTRLSHAAEIIDKIYEHNHGSGVNSP